MLDLSIINSTFIQEIERFERCEHFLARLNRHPIVTTDSNHLTYSAVLLLLFEKNEQTHILFIRRSDALRYHKGEIAFPGGVHETCDSSLKDTALRETMEETGLEPERIRVIAKLNDFITPYDFHITPFVGMLAGNLSCNLNPDEVAEAIEVPLVHLFNQEFYRTGYRLYHGRLHHLHFFRYHKHVIWGITGHILFEFLNKLFRIFSESFSETK